MSTTVVLLLTFFITKIIPTIFFVYIFGIPPALIIWLVWWVYYSPENATTGWLKFDILFWPLRLYELSLDYIENRIYEARKKGLINKTQSE